MYCMHYFGLKTITFNKSMEIKPNVSAVATNFIRVKCAIEFFLVT